jgi:hypothetical protein
MPALEGWRLEDNRQPQQQSHSLSVTFLFLPTLFPSQLVKYSSVNQLKGNHFCDLKAFKARKGRKGIGIGKERSAKVWVREERGGSFCVCFMCVFCVLCALYVCVVSLFLCE